jgi:hypothetical protein
MSSEHSNDSNQYMSCRWLSEHQTNEYPQRRREIVQVDNTLWNKRMSFASSSLDQNGTKPSLLALVA